jgi:hypothetical protein
MPLASGTVASLPNTIWSFVVVMARQLYLTAKNTKGRNGFASLCEELSVLCGSLLVNKVQNPEVSDPSGPDAAQQSR